MPMVSSGNTQNHKMLAVKTDVSKPEEVEALKEHAIAAFGRKAMEDGVFFSPWRGLAAHQPIGAYHARP